MHRVERVIWFCTKDTMFECRRRCLRHKHNKCMYVYCICHIRYKKYNTWSWKCYNIFFSFFAFLLRLHIAHPSHSRHRHWFEHSSVWSVREQICNCQSIHHTLNYTIDIIKQKKILNFFFFSPFSSSYLFGFRAIFFSDVRLTKKTQKKPDEEKIKSRDKERKT